MGYNLYSTLSNHHLLSITSFSIFISLTERMLLFKDLLMIPSIKPLINIFSGQFGEEEFKELPVQLKGIIDARIEESTRPYQKYIPLALAISLFLFLRLIAIPLGWLIILLSLIVFRLLVAFKVVKIEKVEKEAEVIKV